MKTFYSFATQIKNIALRSYFLKKIESPNMDENNKNDPFFFKICASTDVTYIQKSTVKIGLKHEKRFKKGLVSSGLFRTKVLEKFYFLFCLAGFLKTKVPYKSQLNIFKCSQVLNNYWDNNTR